jgi:poly(3-hydroxybutyrate) depolymerase
MATLHPARKAHQEHSVPWFWPLAAAIELGEEGMRLFQRNLEFLVQAHVINAPPLPEWATPNRIDLELDTLRLRDFSKHGSAAISTPVLIDPPYAGHSSSLADYAKGQSLVETLRATGHDRVLVMDWKGATPEMKDYDIDKYLAEWLRVADACAARSCLPAGRTCIRANSI